jgi:hypothetical protein
VCRCLYSNLSHIPSGISQEVVLLDHMADLCLVFCLFFVFVFFYVYFFKKPTYCFQKWMTSLHSHQQGMRVPFSPTSSATFVVGGVLDDGYSHRSEEES